MSKLTFLLIFLFVPYSIFASDEVWKGLYFDQSTLKDAISLVGKPKRQEKQRLSSTSSVSKRVRENVEVETLVYEKIDSWEKVALSFLGDKLIRVKFWPHNKTLHASDLPSRYSANFVAVEGFAKNVNLSVFDGQKEPEVPKVYPVIYFMVAAKPDRLIVVGIKNNSVRAWFPKTTIKLFPGSVEDIEILSRKEETE